MMREQDSLSAYEKAVMNECRERMEGIQGRSLMIDLVRELRNQGDESALLVQCEHSCIAEFALILRYGLDKWKRTDIAWGVKLEARPLAVHVQYTARRMGDRLSWTWREGYNPKRGLSLDEQLRDAMSGKDIIKIPDTFLIPPQHPHEVVTVVF